MLFSCPPLLRTSPSEPHQTPPPHPSSLWSTCAATEIVTSSSRFSGGPAAYLGPPSPVLVHTPHTPTRQKTSQFCICPPSPQKKQHLYRSCLAGLVLFIPTPAVQSEPLLSRRRFEWGGRGGAQTTSAENGERDLSGDVIW